MAHIQTNSEEGIVDSNIIIIDKEEAIKRIKDIFRERCRVNYIKYKSQKFYNLQAEFFAGAMTAINLNIPSWYISILRGEPIIEKY